LAEKVHNFASPDWIRQMFSDPPARIVKGRTKWTHRHATWVDHDGKLVFVESRNELIGLLALQYLRNIGCLRRYKAQPFMTSAELFGQEYTPDLAFQTNDRQLFVVEVKTARFVTRKMEREFESLKARFSDFDIKFLVWTDRDPLIHSFRHNLLRLRRASAEFIEPDEIDRLLYALQAKGPRPLWVLYKDDFDIDLIAHAAWKGRVFVPLREKIEGNSVVSLHSSEDILSTLIGTAPNIHAWWDQLEDAA
jgi:hypothetical protein